MTKSWRRFRCTIDLVPESPTRSDSQISQHGDMRRSPVHLGRIKGQYLNANGAAMKEIESEVNDGQERKLSLESLSKAAHFIAKVQRSASRASNADPDRPASRMSFEPPAKVGVRQTTQIIKDLKARDAEMGENMAKWRRRMVSGGGGRNTNVGGVNRSRPNRR